jgi:DNA-binding response OmpR family regulator
VGTILVVDDEVSIADAVAARLRSEGFEVTVAADGPAAIAACAEVRPDLVVLDLMLPGIDGLEVCRRIQSTSTNGTRVPVLMLTAKDSESDLLVGLAVGADDYLTKPFSPRELVARVRAILRRVDGAPADSSQPITLGVIDLDPAGRRVRVSGEPVHLTPTEFDLALFLAQQPGTVFTRERLLADVWGYASGAGPRTVDSHVRSLRRKLGDALIRTVHGVGYALEVEDGDR